MQGICFHCSFFLNLNKNTSKLESQLTLKNLIKMKTFRTNAYFQIQDIANNCQFSNGFSGVMGNN